jgi:hypothetical protein
LAWILATAADAKLRDPARAVTLAEQAVAAAKTPSARALETLSAAYAAAGRMEDAIRAGERALAAAISSGSTSLEGRLRARLAEYREGAGGGRPGVRGD